MGAEEEDLTDGSGGVYRKVLRAGNGESSPPLGASVTVHYEGWLLDGQKFDSSRDREQPFTFKLGVGEVIDGWDIALAKMAPGEVSTFTVRSDYAYGWEGKPPNIPVDATLRFEIELIGFELPAKRVEDMSHKQKRAHGMHQREEGTALLRGGQHDEAATAFEAGIETLGSLHSLMLGGRPDPSTMAEISEALRSCLLNLTQCQLKLERYEEAVASCSRVLGMRGEAENVKALYRRGSAWLAMQSFEQARDDLRAACVLDPKSKELREQYERAKAAHAAHKQAEKQAFGGMYGEK